ncbi:MAG TPA: hypothetical protein VF108_05390 [Actinomycetota bacterium]
MRRSRIALVMLAVVATVAVVASARPTDPAVRFTDETPRDLREVTTRAWDRFTAAFPGRRGCLGDVMVGVAWQLPDRARYEPEPGLVLIRAPGTAGNLEATLLHEFAHHAEHRCSTSAAFRRRFVAAAGLPSGIAWFGGDAWERIPSERFAEAAVRHVLGETPPHVLITVEPDEVRAVAAWAAGD